LKEEVIQRYLEKLYDPDGNLKPVRLLTVERTLAGEMPSVYGIIVPQKFGVPAVDKHNFTQFLEPLRHGVVALLAHNPGMSEAIEDIEKAGEFMILYNKGVALSFQVCNVEVWEANEPNSTTSDFRWTEAAPWISHGDLFKHIYSGEKWSTVIQTCVNMNGSSRGGRKFLLCNGSK
jgi:hypothetical protein